MLIASPAERLRGTQLTPGEYPLPLESLCAGERVRMLVADMTIIPPVFAGGVMKFHRGRGGERMEDLRTALTDDITSFARRVLAGNGTPQEVAALPSLLMWHSGVNPPAEAPKEQS